MMNLYGEVEWAADLGVFCYGQPGEFVRGRFGQGYLGRLRGRVRQEEIG